MLLCARFCLLEVMHWCRQHALRCCWQHAGVEDGAQPWWQRRGAPRAADLYVISVQLVAYAVCVCACAVHRPVQCWIVWVPGTSLCAGSLARSR